jgi:hypothetical protein
MACLPKWRQAIFITQQPGAYQGLNFSHDNGTLRANLNTGLTAKTFIRFNNRRFTVHHLINRGRTSVYTFLITNTFVKIDINLPHGNISKIIGIKQTIDLP